MSTLRQGLSMALLACALVACSSDEKPAKQDAGSDEGSDEPTNEEDAGEQPEQDAGTTEPTAPVPLTVWVDDLVDNHTTDESEPDTVDDKVISDDTDESSFDKYLH